MQSLSNVKVKKVHLISVRANYKITVKCQSSKQSHDISQKLQSQLNNYNKGCTICEN